MGVIGGVGHAHGHGGLHVVRLKQRIASVSVVELKVLLQEVQHDPFGLNVAAHLQRERKSKIFSEMNTVETGYKVAFCPR